MQIIRHYLLAVQFFTRIPVRGNLAHWIGWSPALQRASAAHLPGVGWLVGAWAAAWLWGVATLLQPSAWMPLVAAIFSTATTLWLTGGLHEDGLADVADGLGGCACPERALEIMKDSRLGAYGVMALVMALLTKVALLALLVDESPYVAAVVLCCVHVLSRLAPLMLMRALPYVGRLETSKTIHIIGKQLGWGGLCVGILWCIPALALWSTVLPWWSGLFMLCSTVGQGYWLQQRLGGITGDCLGACQQQAEIALLISATLVMAGI